MKKILLIILVFGSVVINKKEVFGQATNSKKQYKATISPVKVCASFLRWYVNNQDTLEKSPFFNIGNNGDTTTFYSVNLTI